MIQRDGHVRQLPEHIANKIAAGEVVERPAAVVKELVENSLDAGATFITVQVSQGGRKLILVRDNGSGMEKDDAIMSLNRQATSKITDVDDIEQIDTLGFRGEAIPSIASVSRFTMTTRTKDSDEAVRLQVDAGKLSSVEAAGSPPGTQVEVKDLFINVPARKKFLRSVATEDSHIRAAITRQAIARYDVGFSLSSDGKEVYNLAPAANPTERLRDIFGADFTNSLTELSAEVDGVKVTGLIEKPNLFAPTRHEQFIFVNNRAASAPSIHYAIKDAYPRKQGDVKPAAIIFITLSPAQVDVNVHPTKREVRFRNNALVKSAITKAIESAFYSKAVEPIKPSEPGISIQKASNPSDTESFSRVSFVEKKSPQVQELIRDYSIDETPIVPQEQNNKPERKPIEAELPLAADDGKNAKPWQWFRFLAATESGYLLIETDAGIVFINPHAARERIAFEKISQKSNSSQQLLIPETIRLSPVDFSRLLNSLELLTEMGFQIEEFGPCTFKIDAIPQLIGSLSPAAVLSTIARDLSESHGESGGKWREERIARSIARSFAGSEIKLTEESAMKLVEELCSCKMPYICPRGKPVMIFTSERELNRKFNK